MCLLLGICLPQQWYLTGHLGMGAFAYLHMRIKQQCMHAAVTSCCGSYAHGVAPASLPQKCSMGMSGCYDCNYAANRVPLLAVQARRVRDEAREEQQRLAAERRLTFKQKEKRKRELGQAKGGKGNYVEEEKRIARQFGVYSGFDN